MARPRQNKQTARLSVSFDKEVHERVAALADAHDVSAAWIIRKAISAYLEDYSHSAQIISSARPVPCQSGAE